MRTYTFRPPKFFTRTGNGWLGCLKSTEFVGFKAIGSILEENWPLKNLMTFQSSPFCMPLCSRICDEWNKLADRHQDHHQGETDMKLSRFTRKLSFGWCFFSLATLRGSLKACGMVYLSTSLMNLLSLIQFCLCRHVMVCDVEHTGIRQSLHDSPPICAASAYVLLLLFCFMILKLMYRLFCVVKIGQTPGSLGKNMFTTCNYRMYSASYRSSFCLLSSTLWNQDVNSRFKTCIEVI